MVDAANRERSTGDGVRVGGHQASSASLALIMTTLYMAHLDRADRVSVKPHAAPVFHAIQYLLGRLDGQYLTTLRARGGLQSYPSRTRDPDRPDFSTGSLGLGPAAPLFAAVTRRYVDDHFGLRERSRFVSLLGDGELDEGNVWEAITEPAAWGTCCGSSTTTDSRSTEPCLSPAHGNTKHSSPRPGGTCARSGTGRSCESGSRNRTARRYVTGSTPCPTRSTGRCPGSRAP